MHRVRFVCSSNSTLVASRRKGESHEHLPPPSACSVGEEPAENAQLKATNSSLTRTWKGRANGPGSTASDRCQGARPAAGAETWKSLALRFLTLLIGSAAARVINADWIRQLWEWIKDWSHSH